LSAISSVVTCERVSYIYIRCIKQVPDITALSELNPPSILECLRLRYEQDHMYSYCGTILLSFNPYRWFPQEYSKQKVEQYLVGPISR
jgi:myosin heavy subunit